MNIGNKIKCNTIYLLIGILFISISNLFADSSENDSVIEVKYGVFIKKIDPNFKENKFNVEFYWWAKFKNDSSKTGITNDEIMNLEYVNGFDCDVNCIKNEIQEFKEIAPNEFYYTGFHQGEFYFNPDFRKYPMDVQKLSILVENSLLPINKFRFASDSLAYIFSNQDKSHWGMSSDLLENKNVGFKFFKTLIITTEGTYNSNFGDPTWGPETKYGRIKISTFINRSLAPYISKLLIPLFIILFLVYFVFYLPADKIDIAAGLTVTSLLSAIAFQLSISGDLPDIGYIIYIDKIFYTCYFLIAISMAQSLTTYYLDVSGDPKKIKLAIRIDFIFRFLFPLIFLASLVLFAI